jgi:hypothetical protein
MANEVSVVKPKLDNKEIQTDEVTQDSVIIEKEAPKKDEDPEAERYKQMKSMTEDEVEDEFIDLMPVVDAAIVAAHGAFSKEESVAAIVSGKGLQAVDPVIAVFHYLNIRDQDALAGEGSLQQEYLKRVQKKFDGTYWEIQEKGRKKAEANQASDDEEDSEESEGRKITLRPDYEIGDAYSSSEEESDDESEQILAATTLLPRKALAADSDSDWEDIHPKSLKLRERFKDNHEKAAESDLDNDPPITTDQESDDDVVEITALETVFLPETPSDPRPAVKKSHQTARKYLDGAINQSIRTSMMCNGFWAALQNVKLELKRIMKGVNRKKDGTLFFESNQLRTFANLLIWAKQLWEGIEYEEKLPSISRIKIYEDRSPWKRELLDWTEIWLETVWRNFASLEVSF